MEQIIAIVTMHNIFFFLKKRMEHLYPIHLNIFFCLVIQHQYHFDRVSHFSTIERCPLVFSTNGCLNFWKYLSISILKKSHSEVFWKLPSKTSMSESLLSTLGSFSKSCLEQLFCEELVQTCFCKKEFHNTHYLRYSPEL